MQKLIIVLFALLLSGCGDKVKTFAYYKEHIDEAVKVDKECNILDKSDPAIHKNCQNAASALVVRGAQGGATTAPAYGTYKIDPTIH